MHSFKVIFLVAALIVADAATQSCTNDEECTMSGVTCNDSGCTSCEKGYLLSADATRCLPYVTEYYGECSEDAQCEWLGAHSHCRYVCRCDEGYRWYLGECMKYLGLGDACTDDIECYDGYNPESLICDGGTCSCADGYYKRGDTDCRKIAASINDPCALDIDCKVPGIESVCHSGKCQPPSPQNLKTEFLEDIEHRTELSHYAMYDATECTNDDDCINITHSYCYDKTGTCICEPAYFSNNGVCTPELGVAVGCTVDSECPLKPGKCDLNDGACYCRDYYVVTEDNRKCVKTITEENWNCVSKEWCYALGSHSYCSSSGICNCSQVSEYDEENTLCRWTGENDPGMCVDDVDCKDILNAFCIDEACGCRPGTTFHDDICVPGLGSPCSDVVACEKDLECRDGVCQCGEDYVEFEKKCYSRVDHLNGTCEIDYQCSEAVPYSKCTGTQCECDDQHTPFNNTCYVKTEFGSYCNNRRECTLSLSADPTMGDSVVCRNHICQCPTGYAFKDNRCSSGARTTGSLLVIACSALLLKSGFSIS